MNSKLKLVFNKSVFRFLNFGPEKTKAKQKPVLLYRHLVIMTKSDSTVGRACISPPYVNIILATSMETIHHYNTNFVRHLFR